MVLKDRLERIKLISERLLETPCARIAKLWEELDNYVVKCSVCERRCVIPPGTRGMCGARYNYGGTLYVLTYGNISSISNNPMAKKPFNNFFPDEYALTIGSWGCNFVCPWCQNWEISKQWVVNCNYLDPHTFVDLMSQYNSSGTSFSFNEPSVTLFEYSLDVMPIARKKGYFNTYVTNGYMTNEASRLLVKFGLDAVNIDIKGCEGSIEKWIGADVKIVWRNARYFKENNVHVEITTLIIPGVNDSEKCLSLIAKKIKNQLGAKTPWHVTRYFASYKALERGLSQSTPIKTVELARRIGVSEGLEYVYVGNVLNHPWENTYCPKCGRIIIRRSGLWKVEVLIDDNYCSSCGNELAITFRNKDGKIIRWDPIRDIPLNKI